MKHLRIARTGLGPVRLYSRLSGVAAGLVLAAAPFSYAHAAPAKGKARAVAAAPAPAARVSVADFYRARQGAPLWLNKASGDAAQQLFLMLSNARLDGLDPQNYRVTALQDALAKAWNGDRQAVLRADQMLSEAFVAYVRDLRRDPGGIIYVDPELKPAAPSPFTLLAQAATSPDLPGFIRSMKWMNPTYAELRQALMRHNYASAHERQLLMVNLERARALPADKRRYIVVNIAAQRLTMFEDGKPVDSMRVVIGQTKYPTPMMSGLIRYAVLNPYWNSPADLTAERVAPSVLREGTKFLDKKGYQVLSGWSENAVVVDPATVDWKAVAEGRTEIRVRQLPGPENAMGRVKFMFPNEQGIWLHDTPDKQLLNEAARLYSGGCVRLEDAPRLGEWLFGRRLEPNGEAAEQPIALSTPVPVYLTYLTAIPEGASIAYFKDVYGHDKAKLAGASGDRLAAR
ncbi:L,D-transpeptidase family protein [Sphingomonas lutea]|uniref:L,D-transpeptidase family protein n=1 Tax=Sphingomonas lutea TaxID=1045317 RepID=A0A7G9SJG0_9SPHN|nr:L,D-transpeptidase family protein [Sphingomonas lutea]QNN67985.1 L,D-transpeptidase family protein [Sphingomonas lutea]